jgi:hypothetical protein
MKPPSFARIVGMAGIPARLALTGARETAPHTVMSRARIEVDHVEGNTFRVTVDEAGGSTTHTVTVEPAYATRLAGAVPRERLIRSSFEFLLEREPKEAILRSFDLPVITRYFPEYETEIGRRVRA